MRAGAAAQTAPPTTRASAEQRLEAEAEQVEAARAAEHSDGPDQEAWMPDMRIVGYIGQTPAADDHESTVAVWGRSDESPSRWWTRTVTVRWHAGDWRWVAEPWPTQWAEGTPPDDLIPYLSSEGAEDE